MEVAQGEEQLLVLLRPVTPGELLVTYSLVEPLHVGLQTLQPSTTIEHFNDLVKMKGLVDLNKCEVSTFLA